MPPPPHFNPFQTTVIEKFHSLPTSTNVGRNFNCKNFSRKFLFRIFFLVKKLFQKKFGKKFPKKIFRKKILKTKVFSKKNSTNFNSFYPNKTHFNPLYSISPINHRKKQVYLDLDLNQISSLFFSFVYESSLKSLSLIEKLYL